MRCIAPLVALALWAGPALAVPAFQQLYRRQHHVEVASCLVCHLGGAGGKLNDYGRDFVKAGANWKAFAAVDDKDSDGDGAGNAEEARAGSNPGNPASTPKKPGTWAAGIKPEETLPLEDLAEMFPRAGRFEVKEVDLTDADLAALSAALGGAPLGPEDAAVTFYFAVDTAAVPPARTGVAVFGADATSEGLLMTALGIGPDGRVVRAWGSVFTPTGRDSLKELARQLPGATSDRPFRIGGDLKPIRGKRKVSELAALAFRKHLVTVVHALRKK